MKWARHATRIGEKKMHTKFLSENVKGGDYLENPERDERKTLNWILKKCTVGSSGPDLSGSGWGSVAGCCEHGNEPWAS
jgi:hypothetical protein